MSDTTGKPSERNPGAGGAQVVELELGHLNEALDEALDESFPASDPIAICITFVPWWPGASDSAQEGRA